MSDFVKPTNQVIGDGFIAWQWVLLEGNVVVESALSLREGNETNLPVGDYAVSLRLPASEQEGDPVYVFSDESVNIVGSALCTAWEWKDVWTEHAGEYLRELISRPVETESDDTEEFEGEVIEDVG